MIVGLYAYKAVTPEGDVFEGQREAASQDAVIKWIQAQGQVPIRASEITSPAAAPPQRRRWFPHRQMSQDEVTIFTMELGTLLEAGVPLDRSLELLADLTESAAGKELLSRLHRAVRGGACLSVALEAEAPRFSPFYINMVRAGEEGAAMDMALNRLAEFLQRSRELRDVIVSALVYPLILLLVAGISIALILGFVMPRFAQMFADAGQKLPWATQVVVSGGVLVEQYGWLLGVALLGAYWYFREQFSHPRTREKWDGRLLRLPVAGALVAKIEAARFTRTLGTLLANGVLLLEAMAIARAIVGNRVIARALAQVTERVREGEGLGKPLLAVEVFPRMAAHMLQVGEETGNLESMLRRLAEIYERDVQTTIRRLISFIEPVLILGLGLFVGGIILSVLVAILQVNQLPF